MKTLKTNTNTKQQISLTQGNTGISFTPKEVGEHLVSVKRSGKHIANSPFKINVSPSDVGDASKV